MVRLRLVHVARAVGVEGLVALVVVVVVVVGLLMVRAAAGAAPFVLAPLGVVERIGRAAGGEQPRVAAGGGGELPLVIVPERDVLVRHGMSALAGLDSNHTIRCDTP